MRRPWFWELVGLMVLAALLLAGCGVAGEQSSATIARPASSTTAAPARTKTSAEHKASSTSPASRVPTEATSRPTSTASTATPTVASGTALGTMALFSPDKTPAPEVHVASTATATRCLAFGVAGAGSYRCFTAETTPRGPAFVFDPCFAAPGSIAPATLLCPTDPATDSAVELHAASLPPPSSGATRVWAIELSDRQVCVMVNAAWGALGPFSCGHSDAPATEADCHVPVPGSPWWHAQCQAAETPSSPFVPVRVVEAWR